MSLPVSRLLGDIQPLVEFIRRYGFLLAVLVTISLSLLWPEPAGKGGALGTGHPGMIAVMTLFFLQGLSLPTRDLLAGVRQGRFYGVSFAVIFVLSPLPFLFLAGLHSLFGESSPGALFIGVLYLSFLPTTVSTAVVFSGLVKREAAVPALYVAALTNLVGVFYLPLVFWAGGFGPEQMTGGSALARDILGQLLIPLFFGQGIRLFWQPTSGQAKRAVRLLSHSCVLLIFYLALSRSVLSGVWTEPSLVSWFALVVAVAGLFLWLHLCAWIGQRFRRFRANEKVAMWFCWPQKSAAVGVPLAAILFSESPQFGLILLPLLMYHPLQLLWGAWLVRKLGSR